MWEFIGVAWPDIYLLLYFLYNFMLHYHYLTIIFYGPWLLTEIFKGQGVSTSLRLFSQIFHGPLLFPSLTFTQSWISLNGTTILTVFYHRKYPRNTTIETGDSRQVSISLAPISTCGTFIPLFTLGMAPRFLLTPLLKFGVQGVQTQGGSKRAALFTQQVIL